MHDPAADVIDIVRSALHDCCAPDTDDPPAHGTDAVHFFAGEGPATAVWNAQSEGLEHFGCDEPFVWIRVADRYRTRSVPAVAAESNPCGLPQAVQIEIGVARCAVIDLQPTWADYDAEAAESLDDSRRMEVAACSAIGQLTQLNYVCVSEPILPFGPEGGTIGWSVVLHVQY